MSALHPLHPFAIWGTEPPYSVPAVGDGDFPFKWRGRVFRLHTTASFGKQVKKPGRYAHRLESLAGIWRGRTLHVGARWLCGPLGTNAAVLLTELAGQPICPYCEDVRLGPAMYRCFNSAGQLLYVGATSQLTRRLEHHGRSTKWWHEVAEVRSERTGDMDAAFAAESLAISSESPIRNERNGHREPGHKGSRVGARGPR